MKDEGVGVHVVNELSTRGEAIEADILECGTYGLKLLSVLGGYEKAIIVDAVKWGGQPGQIHRLNLDDVLKHSDRAGIVEACSLHDIDLVATLELGRKLNYLPREVVIVGVEPKRIELGLDLSPEVKSAIPKAIATVLREVAR